MRRLASRLAILAVAVGLVLQALRAAGLVTGGECSVDCACSRGAADCGCAHKTCLAPAAA
ncbi:MAG: hypothetical protein CVU47_05715 [Chloroflexi bacterium HGW-Chloroflexi-9]|nr:MAG: hypothetical protein CVU47_05715 [Chloroflexi bacterium HGW-Chloroflexi-9]